MLAIYPTAHRVKEWQNQVVFLHEVAPGAADRSYGIHVAQLAGLPQAGVTRAEKVLAARLLKANDDFLWPLWMTCPNPNRSCCLYRGCFQNRLQFGGLHHDSAAGSE